MIKPVIPIVEDLFSHFFDEAEHIATIHAKYGANHLQKELTASKNSEDKSKSSLNDEDQVFVHICPTEINCLHPLDATDVFYVIFNQRIESVFLFKRIQPPRLC